MTAQLGDESRTLTSIDGTAADTGRSGVTGILIGVVRIALGWTMLWAALDKIFGLGLATPSERSVLNGASPAKGYLASLEGPASALFNPLAGNPVIDFLFVAGMLLPGIALFLGIGTRIGLVSAALMFLTLWFTALPLENNPFLDQHLFYVLTAGLLLALDAGRYLGLGRFWRGLPVVRGQRWLW